MMLTNNKLDYFKLMNIMKLSKLNKELSEIAMQKYNLLIHYTMGHSKHR
jgi:hypothetical protein